MSTLLTLSLQPSRAGTRFQIIRYFALRLGRDNQGLGLEKGDTVWQKS